MLPDSFSRFDLSGDGYLNPQELWLLLSMGWELSGLPDIGTETLTPDLESVKDMCRFVMENPSGGAILDDTMKSATVSKAQRQL